MVNDNAINPETGETIYVGIFETLPDGYWWISDMDKEDWLKLVRRLTKRALDAANAPANFPTLDRALRSDWVALATTPRQ